MAYSIIPPHLVPVLDIYFYTFVERRFTLYTPIFGLFSVTPPACPPCTWSSWEIFYSIWTPIATDYRRVVLIRDSIDLLSSLTRDYAVYIFCTFFLGLQCRVQCSRTQVL